MKTISRSSLAMLVLTGAIVACNVPGTVQPISINDQAATVIAMTLQAQPPLARTVSVTATSAASTLVTATTTLLSTPTKGAGTATITPTYSTPVLTVLEQTNCREGPGQDYQVVFTYLASRKLEIAGRYDPTNFWLVKSPDTKSGTCWLWGEYVELSGSYWVVPTLTPPPTATLAPPQAPSLTSWNYDCSGGNLNFILEWEDRASDETGYRIFRNGEAVVELPANSTSFTESVPTEAGKETTYYLQVYGPSGTANSSTIKVSC
jgi:hypothetical protein